MFQNALWVHIILDTNVVFYDDMIILHHIRYKQLCFKEKEKFAYRN